ncbi:S-adenosyl-L-methionine-dependent methyltransferase [Glarea lozoyensis ATCC 20868]|uniref:S-adenosyl-L-methionine-dependent methyltransferase n=1 Tax=Glarea lozoyensis (strain ATCC 20868 / MF5171) TaxID=1116229 RepID=S3DX71_GLAL2|nr:S-adenosyl-L-methionine-dependent methyltransferase [Glarea lozoyensis ATCC 20868]EPE30978.1 S-adenosyl-L-methionine-dependent methyltransferase [Glarea lozoyensis ATCC 20868]
MSSPPQETLAIDPDATRDDPALDGEEMADVETKAKLSIDSDEAKEDADAEVILSATASVSSSLYESVEENGRNYHKYKEGKYYLPNDENVPSISEPEPESGQLNSQKNIPIVSVPANLTFEVDDIEDAWVYSHQFSYIHGRLMAFALKNPLEVFKKAFKSLSPGGYFEMQDLNLPIKALDNSLEGTTMQRISELLLSTVAKVGLDPTTTGRYKKMMEEVGFVDIKEVVIEWPIGTWAKGAYHKKLGRWFRRDMEVGTEGILMGLFTRVIGMTREEVLELVVELKREMRDPKIHAYQPLAEEKKAKKKDDDDQDGGGQPSANGNKNGKPKNKEKQEAYLANYGKKASGGKQPKKNEGTKQKTARVLRTKLSSVVKFLKKTFTIEPKTREI